MEPIIKSQKQCELCGETAKSLCLQCNSYFCDSCYKFVHDKKKNLEHKKEVIDPFVPIDTKCLSHPIIPLNLFCIDEKGKLYFIYNSKYRIMLSSMLFFKLIS